MYNIVTSKVLEPDTSGQGHHMIPVQSHSRNSDWLILWHPPDTWISSACQLLKLNLLCFHFLKEFLSSDVQQHHIWSELKHLGVDKALSRNFLQVICHIPYVPVQFIPCEVAFAVASALKIFLHPC